VLQHPVVLCIPSDSAQIEIFDPIIYIDLRNFFSSKELILSAIKFILFISGRNGCNLLYVVNISSQKPFRALSVSLPLPSSGMWRSVDIVWTDVSEERIASIFRIENPRARNQREQVAADWYVPLKRRFTQDLHGATSQENAFFIVTAVKTSNPTQCVL
jgi:hypothetical protein